MQPSSKRTPVLWRDLVPHCLPRGRRLVCAERITEAAIHFKQTNRTISLPQPARHADVIKHCVMDHRIRFISTEHEFGFLTSQGRFVDRCEAWKIAKRTGQISRSFSADGKLRTEDLW